MSRVVVIGGGVGGLAGAARLARFRHEVVLLERAPTFGGKVGLLERDGFSFDTGPSLLTLPATLRDLFMKTGRRPIEESLSLTPLDMLAHYRFPDGAEMDLPNTGVQGIAEAFQQSLGGRTGRDWRRFHEGAERVWESVRTPFIESPLEGMSTLMSLAVRRPCDLWRVRPWRTLRDIGRSAFADDRQRMFLDRYATYTGSDPRRAPAVLQVIPYVEHTFGGWYVDGGLRRIVDAIADRARERGADLRTDSEVARITGDSGTVDGVELTDGSRLAADIVISDVDASVLYERLLPRPTELDRLRRAAPSLSGFVLLIGLRGETDGLRHHTVLLGSDYDAEMDSVFGPYAQPVEDPTIYISKTPDAAPPGHEGWFVLVNAPRHGHGPGAVDWTASGVASSYADHLLDLLAARGLDVRDRIVFTEHRSPADLERETASPGGAIYGTSSNSWRAAFLRPANRSPVPGLFLVGGSAHPGGGLPMVLMSAAITADMIGRAR
ncbi:MAG TPA: phytoene desaturase family protein [Mycobacteriales bacterium]|nr:phytoene desaturase family protein [Mycobacteriales bacterium]